jgi:hypothetical protein
MLLAGVKPDPYPIRRNCRECGAPFVIQRGERTHRLFCGRKCSATFSHRVFSERRRGGRPRRVIKPVLHEWFENLFIESEAPKRNRKSCYCAVCKCGNRRIVPRAMLTSGQARYCSRRCPIALAETAARKAAKRTAAAASLRISRLKLTCATCGCEFTDRRIHGQPRKFCSRRCGGKVHGKNYYWRHKKRLNKRRVKLAAMKKKRQRIAAALVCQLCGQKIPPRTGRGRPGKYCSDTCRDAGSNKRRRERFKAAKEQARSAA